MKLIKSLALCLILIIITSGAHSQLISGYVFGYSVKTINLKRKQPSFDGTLGGVRVSLLKENETIATITTNPSGRYSLRIPEAGNYKLVFSKPGFAMVSATIQAQPDARRSLGDLIVMLKKDGKEAAFCGTLKFEDYDVKFVPAVFDKVKDDLGPTNVELFRQSVSNNKLYPKGSSVKTQVIKEESKEVNKDSLKQIEAERELQLKKVTQAQGTIEKLRQLSSGELDPDKIQDLQSFIDEATLALEDQDTTSTEYIALKAQIELAQMRLQDQKDIVASKEKEVDQANKKLTYISLFAVVMILFIGVLVYFLFQRKKFNRTLSEKNEKIQSTNDKLMSSIRYASIIQKSFLNDTDQIKKMFGDSFIYYSPKDVVSGDFYWVGEVGAKRIVVASDCTGHGVPGAMLTVLGHAALNSIIKESNITEPKEILSALNKKLIDTFEGSDEGAVNHGMDLTVLSYDTKTNKAKICGAVNGAYVLSGSELSYLDANYQSLGEPISNDDFITHELELKQGDMLFLSSDGYQDQFKGGTDEIETYNLDRFEKLLLNLAQKPKFAEANSILKKELTDWKKDRDQVDDILVLGIKF